MQVFYVGFGGHKHQKILWRCTFLAIIWIIWLEQNDRIFYNRTSDYIYVLWDRVVFLASLWSFASGAFPNYLMSDIQRDWRIFL